MSGAPAPTRGARGPGLRTRISLVVFGALATISTMVLIIAPVVGDLRRELRFQREVIEAAEEDVSALTAAAVDQETGQRGFLLAGREEFLAPYESGREAADLRLAELRAVEDVPGLQPRVEAVAEALAEWQEGAAEPEIVERRRGGDVQPLVLQGDGRRLFSEVRSALAELDRHLDTQAIRTREQIDDTLRRLVLTVLFVFGLGATACLLVWGLLRSWITEPVEQLVLEVGRVSAGDFEHPVRISGPAELEEVAAATDAMRHEIVERLLESTRAREALEQRAPAVVALRSELEPPTPELPPGIDVATRYEPVEGLLAGDFSDVIVLPGGRVAIVVADASGHGAPVVVRALRAKHLLGAALAGGIGPADSFELVAPRLADAEGCFVSALVIVVAADGTLTWAGAGHPPGLIHSGEGIVELDSTGPVLGPVPGPWEERSITIEPPWVGLFLTDGILEARAADRVMFGDSRIRGRLLEADPAEDGGAESLVTTVLGDLRDFLVGDRPADDVTVVAVRVSAGGQVLNSNQTVLP